MTVLDVIKKEHREAEQMLDEAKDLEPGDERLTELTQKIEKALTMHLTIEERLFYARLRERAVEEEKQVDVFEAYTEHEVARHLIDLLKSRRKRDARFKAEVQVLGESVKHHVEEEESTVFAIAREVIDQDELEELADKWQKAKAQMTARAGKPGPGRKKAPAAKRTAAKKSTAKRPAAKRPAARATSKRKTAGAGRKRR
jgi:hemerythrin-like domain-containing protein